MTDSMPPDAAPPAPRPYSPGLEGIVAAETSLGYVDGEAGRLLYRGYRIGDLVEHGTYPAVANLLWTGEWEPRHHLPTAPVPDAPDPSAVELAPYTGATELRRDGAEWVGALEAAGTAVVAEQFDAGWRVSDVKVMLIVEGEPELTLYESGKVLVKTHDEAQARDAIDRVYAAIGMAANPTG